MLQDILNVIPWLVLLVVFVGEKLQQWSVNRTFAAVLERAQTPQQPAPASRPAATPAPPAVALPAPAAVKPVSTFAAAPPWFQAALHEIGFHETGANQGLDRYIAMAHCGENGQPWCAIFANAMLESSGIAGTRSPSSQSFRTHPAFVPLAGPALGAIVVFWRISQSSGQGHVGFYRGEDASRIWTLGGNENDMVQIEALPKSSDTFGLIGYWWPKGVPLPATGAVLMPTGSPTSVQTAPSDAAPGSSGRQINITATVFGGPKSAYAPFGPIDDSKPGVALPFRFEGERPRVRVTNKAGVSVDCDIVDVGPWNTHDPYWQTGTRPEAETMTDMTGRHTNSAGIDLTAAAAKALGIDGKGLVSWEFIASPLAPTPNVT